MDRKGSMGSMEDSGNYYWSGMAKGKAFVGATKDEAGGVSTQAADQEGRSW